jgi:hypothetical protein
VNGPTLRDRTGFWLGLAGVLAAIGAVPVGIGIGATTVSPAHKSLWSSPWFDMGIAAVLLAVAFCGWSLILYVAHSHAEKHWCPDLSAHVLPSPVQPSPEGKTMAQVSEIRPRSPAIREPEKTRSVLRSLRLEISDSLRRVERAVKTGRYWRMSGMEGGPLPNRVWKKNQEQLSGLAGMGDLYDSLYEAYQHVERINGYHFARVVRGHLVKDDDRLGEALTALRNADDQLRHKLLDLSA